MGFAVRVEKGSTRPELVCDTCGKSIDDLATALVAFAAPKSDGLAMAHVYHKGVCDPGHAGVREPDASFWQELRNYLPWLIWDKGWGDKDTTAGEVTIKVPKFF